MIDALLLEQLAQIVTAHVGHRIEPLSRHAISNAASRFLAGGVGATQLLQQAFDPHSHVAKTLIDAMSIGETYFFRQPEHFELVIQSLASRFATDDHSTLRVWSAGCASGEEAYSWAAALLGARAGRQWPAISVIGTDVAEAHLVRAREGTYGKWSVRESGRSAYPVVTAVNDGWRVIEQVAACCTFVRHNLLDPISTTAQLGHEKFDVISCRNVLIYMTPAAQRLTLEHVLSALRPGGLMVFSTVDLAEPPAGLTRLGPPELNVFVKKTGTREARPMPSDGPRTQPVTREPTPIDRHLQALELIEAGANDQALATLDALVRSAPDYVPGLLERALYAARLGDITKANRFMRSVLELTAELAEGEVVTAPQPMPVSFYRASAKAFLSRMESP